MQWILLVTALCFGFVQTEIEDPVAAYKSKDPEERLAAIRALIGATGEIAELERNKLLVRALKDDDWEVAEEAARALGRSGYAKAFDPLVELALKGPVRSLRRTAAFAVGGIDAEEAYAAFAKKATGRNARIAAQAMAELFGQIDEPPSVSALEKGLKRKEPEARAAAAWSLMLFSEDRAASFDAVYDGKDADVRMKAGLIEGAGLSKDTACLSSLRRVLEDDDAVDVLVRRSYKAQRAIFEAHPDKASALLVQYKENPETSDLGRSRIIRLLGILGEEVGGKRAAKDKAVLDFLAVAAEHSSAEVRIACAGALRRLATPEAMERARALARDDANAQVRRTALDAVERVLGREEESVRDLALHVLANDSDAKTREVAAVALGLRGSSEAVEALVSALKDPDEDVAICAAVSLGMTGSQGALEPLLELMEAERWTLRGAALVGLSHLRRKESVDRVIAALEDTEPVIRRTAREFLRSIANRDLEGDVAAWESWWGENKKRVRMSLSEEVLKRRRELGYSTDAAAIYRGLDVIVFQDRGDHMEIVLDALGIEHRLTRSGRVDESELHPDAVFVSNCPGQINGADVERLAWFTRVGGYLMGSCWSLRETISRIHPGMLKRLSTKGEVLDEVRAEPCVLGSPYLEGVFPSDCRPIYQLQGAFLIQVLDHERVEVLVDSPECADNWGGGNLVAWFPAGHGVILDSVNHFDLQGFSHGADLKKAKDRMAYAIDHMGMSYERLRELRKERFWKKAQSAAKNVRDLSAFRLITNFVRRKRAAGAD